MIIGLGSDLIDIRRIENSLTRHGDRFGISNGVFWRDMGVVNDKNGKPTMKLTNGAAKRLAEIIPSGYEPVVHVTITDDFPLAQAFVIIEALPQGS